MRITMDTAGVAGCEVRCCAYNVEGACHARAITIGDTVHPACDTFIEARHHVRRNTRDAGVGACKVTRCRFNVDFECEASAIRVGTHDDHGDCLTFAAH